MYQYTAAQWIFFFFFYCFFGWCFESTYVSICQRKPVNRGFIRGPFLPLYGSGAIMMLVVSGPVRDSLVLTYLAGCVGATALEYVTGVGMEALFKVRYWDYSHKKFNFQGQICLSSTLCWGLLTVLMTRLVHAPVEALSERIPRQALTALDTAVLVGFTMDFLYSFRAAMDLRNILVMAERARQELEHMQKRLDVLIAVADEELENRIEKGQQRIDGLRRKKDGIFTEIEARFSRLREALPLSGQLREKRDEIMDLREKYVGDRRAGEARLEAFLSDIGKRGMLRGNPTMTSRSFQEALEDLKRQAASWKRQTQKAGSGEVRMEQEEPDGGKQE